VSDRAGHKNQIRYSGRAVSRGLAVGRIVSLYGERRQFFRASIPESAVPSEIRRLQSAITTAKQEIQRLIRSDNTSLNAVAEGILDTHILVLEDQSFHSKLEHSIEHDLVNAEWAVKSVTDSYLIQYRSLDNSNIRERAADISDIAERIQSALGGRRRSPMKLPPDSVLAAKEIRPSTMIEFGENRPIAIVTEHGGWTSHAYILARELDIPAVTGLRKILRHLRNGDRIIVDGYRGEVVLNPTAETESEYRSRQPQPPAVKSKSNEPAKPTKTLDGHLIRLTANLDSVNGLAVAKRMGARGVGLFRSEFLVGQYGRYPTEAQQFDAYRALVAAAGGELVNIRTFDIGVGQISGRHEDRERNPALGLRGIRLSLSYKSEFAKQIRALLRASAIGPLNIVLPMVGDIAEIASVRGMIAKVAESLKEKDVPIGEPKVGIMIEVPAAAIMADDLCAVADFFCLGTNDLIQYLLAADRDNENVAGWYQTLHPAVLRTVRDVIAAGKRGDRPVSICGEMAGSSFYVPLLVGMGAEELSMNANSLPEVQRVIGSIAFEEAQALARSVLQLSNAKEIEAQIREQLHSNWSHLFPGVA
jgi:phosphoenolpyruvate-protein phosphotransferase (PTS system enzyme I)